MKNPLIEELEKRQYQKELELFIDETGALYVVHGSEVIECLDSAVDENVFQKGYGHGLYYETCGGYACQIHGAAYLSYEADSVMLASNLEPYDCECEECETMGYEKSECCQKDWSMIDYMDECYDGLKLYWIDMDHALENSKTKMKTIMFLLKHFSKEVIREAV